MKSVNKTKKLPNICFRKNAEHFFEVSEDRSWVVKKGQGLGKVGKEQVVLLLLKKMYR